jgi:NAD(P)-dependent dehydrogenase (short-subunit alcohol dehydrogenase family)
MRGQSPMRDRTAVVTGAARGVGAEVARGLVRRGARVALLGHEEAELHRLAEWADGRAVAVPVDVTDESGMAEAAARVRRRLGPPSVVVANAGIAAGGPLSTTDPQLWERIVRVNLVGSMLTARVFLPDLCATRGYYLLVSSTAALGAAPLMSAYCASKSGSEAFAHALRAELSDRGVAVGVGYLNWTDTDMIRAADRHPTMRLLRGAMPWPSGRVHPAGQAAERLVQGIERRSTAVYTPRWLWGVRAVRGFLPGVVARGAALRLSEDGTHMSDRPATGLLGAGGRADDTVRRR